jgi:hypothetical protein
VPQTRYLANDGQAIVVRPTGNPAGTRVYEMKWDSVKKSIKVYNPLDGSFITDLPGRWTGRKEIGQAVRRCVKSFLEIERESDVNRYNQQVGLKDCVFGCPLEGLLSSGVSTIQSLV